MFRPGAVGEELDVVAEQPLGGPLHMQQVVDSEGMPPRMPVRNCRMIGLLHILLAAEVIVEDVEMADVVALELHGDAVLDQDVDHAVDLGEGVIGDDV